MRRLSLYIDGKKADIREDNYVLVNYARSEVYSPAVVKNSYTQAVTLPGTTANEAIFASFERSDWRHGSSFSPIRKTPFVIQDETGKPLMKGYCKLDSVTTGADGNPVYRVTLFGGLGGFFYRLSYNDDGSKKTLADLYYHIEGENHGEPVLPKDVYWGLTANEVASAWSELIAGSPRGIHALVNFAPCYNGYHPDMDCNKAYYKPGTTTSSIIPNIEVGDVDAGYGPRSDADGGVLLEFEHKHTEWETMDLRAWAQRPVLNLLKFFQAISLPINSGDTSFEVNDVNEMFFYDRTPYYADAWVTLPLVSRAKIPDPSSIRLSQLLDGTSTPADYLIGYAKMFGLCFHYDAVWDKIWLMSKEDYFYYGLAPLDWSDRISREREVTPVAMESQRYVFRYPKVYGQFAEEYEKSNGRRYGQQAVDTGYEFNANSVDVLGDIVYRGAADVRERSIDYRYYGGDSDDQGSYQNYALKFAFSEEVKWTLYSADGKDTATFYPIPGYARNPFPYGSGYDNFATMPQLHGEDNKGESGEDVLLFLCGSVKTPVTKAGSMVIADAPFHLSNDCTAMLSLNGDKPCYDVSPRRTGNVDVYELPQFRRTIMAENGTQESWDFGLLTSVGAADAVTTTSIYSLMWQNYMTDLYDRDTRLLKVKADLTGVEVNEELLRRYVYYDGAIWSIMKIENHSLTTDDLTEVTLVKVQDINNYREGDLR